MIPSSLLQPLPSSPSLWTSCPDSFSDVDLLLLLKIKNFLTEENDCKTVQGEKCLILTCGLVLKCYQGVKRLLKKSLMHPPSQSSSISNNKISSDGGSCCDRDLLQESIFELDTFDYKSSDEDYLLSIGTEAARLFVVVRYYTREEDRGTLERHYSPRELHRTAYELTKKLQTVSPKLVPKYYEQPLHSRDSNGNLRFEHDFLYKLAAYHKSIQRPEGTYDIATDSFVEKLASLPRESCPNCNKKCQLFCGECGGIRMPGADSLLPPKIKLPFDILLLLHWHETLHKCTGIQAGALCEEGIVRYEDYPRLSRGGDIVPLIASLDHTRDILLFPADSAIDANQFDWNFEFENSISSSSSDVNSILSAIHSVSFNDTKQVRNRIIVLEASWQHAKVMDHQIKEIRKELKLPEIRCIKLSGLVGKYWKFHREGNSAVSTIEAIAHLSEGVLQKQNQFIIERNLKTSSSGDHFPVIDTETSIKSLLTLFFVQQYRVLSRVKDGGRMPQAMDVMGTAEGSWRELTKHIVLDDNGASGDGDRDREADGIEGIEVEEDNRGDRKEYSNNRGGGGDS